MKPTTFNARSRLGKRWLFSFWPWGVILRNLANRIASVIGCQCGLPDFDESTAEVTTMNPMIGIKSTLETLELTWTSSSF